MLYKRKSVSGIGELETNKMKNGSFVPGFLSSKNSLFQFKSQVPRRHVSTVSSIENMSKKGVSPRDRSELLAHFKSKILEKLNFDLQVQNEAESLRPSKSLGHKFSSQSPPKNLWSVVENFEAGVKSYKEELESKKHMNINKSLATSIEL